MPRPDLDGQGKMVAQVHYYRQLNGSYRAEPDPKQLVVGDALYVLDPGS